MTLLGDIKATGPGTLSLPMDGLDILMPMALLVAPTGHIAHAGPTLQKLRPGLRMVGRRFLEVFELRRPRGVSQFGRLVTMGGGRLQMQFRDAPPTALKGIGVVLPGAAGMLINLSFGIGAVDALGAYDLSSADFAPTDLTVEMLYLVEANAGVQLELRRLNQRLSGAKSIAEEQAQTDTLTGLRNRRALDQILERYRSGCEAFSLMLLDLDYFKNVNDELGHDAGDLVLQNVARILLEETRDEDTVVRTGGDEFVLIFDRANERDPLKGIAQRLLDRLAQPVMYEGKPCRISGSIGIAVSSDYASADPANMLRDADAALYVSKNSGRSRFSFATVAAEERGAANPPVSLIRRSPGK